MEGVLKKLKLLGSKGERVLEMLKKTTTTTNASTPEVRSSSTENEIKKSKKT